MKLRKRIKRYFVYLLVRFLVLLVLLLPLILALKLGAIFGRIAHVLAVRDRRRAIDQARVALGLDEVSARHLIRRVFENMGRVAIEIAMLPRLRERFASYVELPDESRRVLESAHQQGKGVLFVSAHLGNWELLAQRVAFEGFDSVTFARKGSNPYLADWLVTRRRAGGVETIARGDPRSARTMISALRRGAVIGALIDQDTTVDSVHVPFFGRPASTPVAPAALAIRADRPVVVGFIERKEGLGHRVRIEAIDIGKDAKEATAILTRAIEDAVRRRPEEWVWFHERWKR